LHDLVLEVAQFGQTIVHSGLPDGLSFLVTLQIVAYSTAPRNGDSTGNGGGVLT